MKLRHLLRILFLFLAAAVVPVHAAGWTQVRSANFVLVGDAGEPEMRRAAARLELFRETMRQLFPQIKLDGGVRTNVILFRDAASYAPFKPKRADGEVDTAVAGFFQAGYDVNYITLAADARSGAYNTIFHEYVHFLLDANIGRPDIPPWLGEGLAEYFETLQVLDDKRVLLGTPPQGHVSLLRKNGLIPLSEFFAVDNASLHRRGDTGRGLFYAQAWAFAHYLLNSERSPRQLEDILGTARGGDAAARSLFGPDLESLAASVREYIASPALPNKIVSLRSELAVNTEVSASPISEAAAQAFLGDLLAHMERSDEAEPLLRKALRAEPGLPLANAVLGLVLVQRRDFDAAEKFLEKALAADASSYFINFNYAYALSSACTDEYGQVSEFPPETARKMRSALGRAISLNPGFAESYRLLAFVNFVNDENLDEAAALLNKGLAIKPGDARIQLLLAQVLLRQNRYDEANSIARKISSAAADPEIWADAQSIIRSVNAVRAASAVKPGDAEAIRIFGPLPPLILKRSTLTDADVARYEDDRQITNLNLMIDRPRFGERQAVAYIENIACTDGEIVYSIREGTSRFRLTSKGFGGIGMRVLTEGNSSFTLDCGGVSFAKQLTVITYRTAAWPDPNTRGTLVSIAFVPENFRLKTPEEMASTRRVIIEDDRLFKNRAARTN